MIKLKEKRENLGMTQDELAEKSGVARSTIARIEGNDTVAVTTATLGRLADALKCTISEIFLP